MMKKYLSIVVVVLAMALILFLIADLFSPGSYANAETYELAIDEPGLISIIEKFKTENPEFQVPNQTGLLDHKNEHWYIIYFYYQEENQILYTWTRPTNSVSTTMAFVSVNDGLLLGNWKTLNKDYNYAESKVYKKKFEERILNKIKKSIAH